MGIQEIGFGDFCTIEQKRYVGPNEFYGYKVVGRKKSNVWTDVPVDANNGKETRHDYMDDVVTVVCNNLDDRTVYQFRVSDLASVKKAQAVPEWFDYTKQSPQMDGNYQIFIKGEQITAKWVSRFGFADPIEGDALRQELITHWAMQPQSPKAQEPAND